MRFRASRTMRALELQGSKENHGDLGEHRAYRSCRGADWQEWEIAVAIAKKKPFATAKFSGVSWGAAAKAAGA